jgi:DNA-binding transcriptional LysR family regulator
MDLRRLKFFVTVADGLNVSRAAEVLNISQSALSRQIQNLEWDLGFQLFDRVGKRLVLTVEGERLLPKAAKLLEDAQSFSLLGRSLAVGQIGFIRIGATPQTIASLLSEALADFSKMYPGIEVTLVEGTNETLLDAIEKGAVHLVVAALPANHDLAGRELFYSHLLALLPPNDPRSALSLLPIQRLAESPVLTLSRGFMTRQLFDEACTAGGVRPRIFLESASPHTLVALAQKGHGVAVLSSSASVRPQMDKAIQVVFNDRPIGRMVSAIWNPKRHQPAGFSDLIDIMKYCAANRKGTREPSA